MMLWIGGLFIFLLLLIRYFYQRKRRSAHYHPIRELRQANAILVYNDEKQQRVFFSKRYQIAAKPDFIYRYQDGTHAIVEYKSRTSDIYPSDRMQLIATAIAVKESGKYQIKRGFILNRNGQYEKIDFDIPTDILFAQIEQPLTQARSIKQGNSVTPCPTREKCTGCGFREICHYAFN